MKTSKKLLKYAKENYNEVLHTTLNPDGPGVVRIHLIPPVIKDDVIESSVAIINGQDIVPVRSTWTILLSEFIKQVNQYNGREIKEEEYDLILTNSVKAVKKVYPFASAKRLKEDIYIIMKTFTQIARGEMVDEEVGYMSMGEYAPFMRAPHRMDLMVSAMTKNGHWHCNQKCIHCYAAGQVHAEEEELDTQQWKQIIDKCRKVGIPQLTFTGGEPTMRDDLIELIDYSQWFVTRLNTNGINLTKEYCDKLREASLDSCQITFYSHKEEIHNRLVGASQYENTVKGIENAISQGLNVSINTPLCTLNKDYLDTLAFLHDKGVLYVTCSGLITTGNATTEESENLQLSSDEMKAILKEAVVYCYANGMEISFTSPGWVEDDYIADLGINVPSCGACLSNMAVTPSGNVVPCQSWLSDDVMGNMLVDSWAGIWESPICSLRREYSAQMLGECPLRRKNDEE